VKIEFRDGIKTYSGRINRAHGAVVAALSFCGVLVSLAALGRLTPALPPILPRAGFFMASNTQKLHLLKSSMCYTALE